MKLKRALFSFTLIVMLSAVGISQNQRIAADNTITNELRQEGVKYETKRAVLWVEKGSLTQGEIEEFGALVNQGIIAVEKYSGIKFDKDRYRTGKVEYFISSKAGISHVSIEHKPFIYLTPARVKMKKAPYLHETTHVIAWKSLKSLWLQEGFASHVQTFVSENHGGYAGNPHNPENTDIDQLARNLLKSEQGKKVLPLIGLNGTPLTMSEEQSKIYAPIFEDRKVMAPAFYNLSESFVKFLVEKVGMSKFRKICDAPDTQAGVLKVTGKNIDEWKTDWINSLTA